MAKFGYVIVHPTSMTQVEEMARAFEARGGVFVRPKKAVESTSFDFSDALDRLLIGMGEWPRTVRKLPELPHESDGSDLIRQVIQRACEDKKFMLELATAVANLAEIDKPFAGLLRKQRTSGSGTRGRAKKWDAGARARLLSEFHDRRERGLDFETSCEEIARSGRFGLISARSIGNQVSISNELMTGAFSRFMDKRGLLTYFA